MLLNEAECAKAYSKRHIGKGVLARPVEASTGFAADLVRLSFGWRRTIGERKANNRRTKAG